MILQGTEEWHLQRVGNITASRIHDIMAKTKSGYSSSRQNYLADLVVEILTGGYTETYQSQAMRWGIEKEPEARTVYEFLTDQKVMVAEYAKHPTILDSGASPDGLVGNYGLIEIKCPNTATHVNMLIKKSIPKQYYLQMQWQLECTERKWCDFVSYDPRMPPEFYIFIKRISKDEQLLETIREEVIKFREEINSTLEKLNNRC